MTSPHLASLFLLTGSSPHVETVGQTLAKSSDSLFFWLVFSSIVTGVGVIFEAPGEFHEFKRWLKLKRLGKKIGWGIPIASLGLLLVTGGIIGEGIFEYLSGNAETAIRAHDEEVLGDTIIQAGTAKDSAEAAATAAGTAHAEADTADRTANKADEKAGTALDSANLAEKRADAVKREVASAQAELNKIEAEIARVDAKYSGRTLSNTNRDIFITSLRESVRKPNEAVDILVSHSAPDGVAFAQEIAQAINDPSTGWKASANTIVTSGDAAKTGVWIVVNQEAVPDWAGQMQHALQVSGIEAKGLNDPSTAPWTAHILICRKN